MKNASETLIRSAHVRLGMAEDVGFQELVDRLQTSRSRLLRKVIRELIGEGPDLLPNEMKVFLDAVYQLASLGRNLNQLLKLVHGGQVVGSSQQQALIVIDRTRERWVRHVG